MIHWALMPSVFMKLHSVKETVRSILKNEPKTRDDDQLLILKVWTEVEPFLRNPSYSFVQFSKLWLSKKLPSSESIRRCRQKLQEHDPFLRGESYLSRHKEIKNVQNDLNDPSFKPGGTP